MMRVIALLLTLCVGASAQMVPGFPPGTFQSRAALDVTSSGCAPATAFLARTSGQDATHTTAYTNLICGLNSQASTLGGTLWSRLDALWMTRAADSTVVLLNLVSASFPLAANGTITFAADSGVTSNGTTGYYTTGYNPTAVAGQYTQNSARLAVCLITSSAGGVYVGATDPSTAFSEIDDLGNMIALINNVSIPTFTTDEAPALYAFDRTASNLLTAYENAAGKGTDTGATVGLTNAAFYVLARNFNGSPDNFTTATVSMIAVGAGYSATDETNFRTLVQAYMAAIGSAAC